MAGIAPGVPRSLARRYRLVRLLARGGMAEVWEGRDDVLSRPVAIKVLLPPLAADPLLRERFRREAVTAARLVHPGIVAIYDAGVELLDEGDDDDVARGSSQPGRVGQDRSLLGRLWPEHPSTAFIIMELVPGETLRDLMQRAGPLPPDLAVAIASQAADALAHAHAHGLVHRDIKPANVLLRDEGGGSFRVKVADFGIAKAVTTTSDLTANGTFLGTPKYVSPEQVQGSEPDGRADVYSLGVVMFEMLAGRPPFQEGSDMATALAHVQKPPPRLEDIRPDLPSPLYEVVSATLVKDPGRRTGSALAFSAALTSARKSLGVPATEPGGALHLDKASVSLAPRPAAGTRTHGDHRLGQPAAAGAVATTGSAATVDNGPGAEQAPAPAASPGPAGSSTTAAPSAGAAATSRQNGPGEGRGAKAASSPSSGRSGAARKRAWPLAGRHAPSRPARHRAAGRLTAVITACLLIAGVSVALVVFRHQDRRPGTSSAGRSGPGGRPSSTLPAANRYPVVPVAHVYELAQHGNHANDDLSGLQNVTSNNPGAYWESVKYYGPNFGNFGGLGLVLHLKGTHVLHELDVVTPMQGWSAETFVSNSYSSSVAGWGRDTWQLQKVNGDQRFSLGGKSGSWVLFWMLDPGPAEQAVVDKLAVR